MIGSRNKPTRFLSRRGEGKGRGMGEYFLQIRGTRATSIDHDPEKLASKFPSPLTRVGRCVTGNQRWLNEATDGEISRAFAPQNRNSSLRISWKKKLLRRCFLPLKNNTKRPIFSLSSKKKEEEEKDSLVEETLYRGFGQFYASQRSFHNYSKSPSFSLSLSLFSRGRRSRRQDRSSPALANGDRQRERERGKEGEFRQ